MIYTSIYSSPLGSIVIESDGEVLTGLRFEDSEAKLGEANAAIENVTGEAAEIPIIEQVRRWLDDYFAGRKPRNIPRLNPKGTAFQRRVWQVLFTIDYGQTKTYGEIAKMVGCKSAQAVGQAISKNPIVIIIPCHRVVGANGALGGYAFDVERKEKLLKLERA